MSRYYDRAGNPIAPEDLGAALARDRRVGLTNVGGYNVSTVHLVIDHNWDGGRPLIFVGMVRALSEITTEEGA